MCFLFNKKHLSVFNVYSGVFNKKNINFDILIKTIRMETIFIFGEDDNLTFK